MSRLLESGSKHGTFEFVTKHHSEVERSKQWIGLMKKEILLQTRILKDSPKQQKKAISLSFLMLPIALTASLSLLLLKIYNVLPL